MEILNNTKNMISTKKYKIISIIGFSIMLLGCREYKHYSFDSVELDLWGGELQVGLEGSYRDYEKDGKKHQVRSNPYVLVFRFYYPNTENIDVFKVTETKLIGSLDKVSIMLGSEESSYKSDLERKVDKNDKRFKMGVSFNALKKVKLSYQAYDLSCLVKLYRDSKLIESKVVKIRLETDLKKGKRNDLYDSMMGV